MFITWYGQFFFEIEIKNNQGEKIIIATEPFDENLGLKVPKIDAQILLLASARNERAYAKIMSAVPFLINEPGEYEFKEVFIRGISSVPVSASVQKEKNENNTIKNNTIYKIEAEKMKICYLGALAQKELDENQIEEIGQVDILMIPVGGSPFVDAKGAANIISQIEPHLIIPMCYKIPNLKQDVEGVEKFLKIMGREGIAPQKKIKISPKDLSKEENEIVILEP